MALKIKQVAEIVDNEVVVSPESRAGDVVAVLTNLDSKESDFGPQWTLSLTIGEGVAAREVVIELPVILTREEYEASASHPVFLPKARQPKFDLQLSIFRDWMFAVEPAPRNASMQEEAMLRIKRQVYARDAEVASLKSYVANVEAAITYKAGSRREPITDDVKMLVWSRDGGACTRCGSKTDLHFDHIIPVAKGGSSTAENIQILCRPCNLRKSDKIAF